MAALPVPMLCFLFLLGNTGATGLAKMLCVDTSASCKVLVTECETNEWARKKCPLSCGTCARPTTREESLLGTPTDPTTEAELPLSKDRADVSLVDLGQDATRHADEQCPDDADDLQSMFHVQPLVGQWITRGHALQLTVEVPCCLRASRAVVSIVVKLIYRHIEPVSSARRDATGVCMIPIQRMIPNSTYIQRTFTGPGRNRHVFYVNLFVLRAGCIGRPFRLGAGRSVVHASSTVLKGTRGTHV